MHLQPCAKLVPSGLFFLATITIITLMSQNGNGQPFNNETNSTETESPSGTFLDCYSSFYGGMYLWKMFGHTNIDVTDSELKQFFTHICNFVHDETGNWLYLSKLDELKMLLNQVDLDKFKTKYYPQGIPQSVIDVFSGMMGMAGVMGNGTNTTPENE
jgi:hypothetical protein